MRNLTITVPERVARWAKVLAARRDSSVSRVVGELLTRMMEEETGYEAAMRQYLGGSATALKRSGGYPDRDALHDRADLR